MAASSDKSRAIASVYAAAMLALASRRGAADELRGELDELARLAAIDRRFAAFLANPLIDDDRRAESLERMFRSRASDLLVDSLQVIHRKGRIALVPQIAAAYASRHDAHRGVVEVAVASAVPLDDRQRDRLRAAVRAATGNEPRLVERVAPELLGGLVVRIGDRKADSSIATRLRTLSEALLARASHEILSGTHVEYGT
jgi:F-type H+-transporting ATPase subunit delta